MPIEAPELNDAEEMRQAAEDLREQVLTDIMNAEDSELKETIARQYAEELGTTHKELLRVARETEEDLETRRQERAA